MNFHIGAIDLLLVSPLIALFLFSLLPISIKTFVNNNKEPRQALTLTYGIMGLVTCLGLLTVFSGAGKMAFNNMLIFDGLTFWMSLISLIAAMVSLFLMHENPSTSGRQFSELVFLTLGSTLGLIIFTAAADLMMVFIGMEIMSLSLYLMIALSHEEKVSKEASFKYFVMGSFSSAIFLYGMALIYGASKTTQIYEIFNQSSQLMSQSPMFLIGLCLVLVGLLFKISVFPFHFWTPDVYQGAPTPHTSYMSTAVKAASFAVLLRVVASTSLNESENLIDVLQWLAVLTMTIGNVTAIVQKSLKRMLAYSSVAHSGYLLVGVIAVAVSETRATSASAVVFYLFGYAIMTLAAFAVVSILEKNEYTDIKVDDLAGLSKKRPLISLSFAILMLSLAGIPPTLGFFGKFYLFNAALGEGLVWLTIWGVINSVISAYYYLRPLVAMYMKSGDADIAEHSIVSSRSAILLLSAAALLIGLISSPIFQAIESAL
ncbi:MAG TPA: NADH-quinone oxidoreductase subunit N [Pseudobdellovibrionaceae bacterium]|nr:NADH-quinone oxidoreductase subunit N [Pseudobdellovibrionaceae bacterium]